MYCDLSLAPNITGIAAFLSGVIQLSWGFLLVAGMHSLSKQGKISWLLFCSLGLASKLTWLVYLWPLNDFFIRSFYALEALCFLILAIHMARMIRGQS